MDEADLPEGALVTDDVLVKIDSVPEAAQWNPCRCAHNPAEHVGKKVGENDDGSPTIEFPCKATLPDGTPCPCTNMDELENPEMYDIITAGKNWLALSQTRPNEATPE